MAAIRPLAAGAVLAAVLVVPVALPYFAARQSVGERPRVGDRVLQRHAAGLPGGASAQRRCSAKSPPDWRQQERELFQGVLRAAHRAGRRSGRRCRRQGSATSWPLLLAFEVSLGFNGFSYEWLHAYVAALPGAARAGADGDSRRAVVVDSGGLRSRAAHGPAHRAMAGAVITRRLACSCSLEYRIDPDVRPRLADASAGLRTAAAASRRACCSSCRSGRRTSISSRSTCTSRRFTGTGW